MRENVSKDSLSHPRKFEPNFRVLSISVVLASTIELRRLNVNCDNFLLPYDVHFPVSWCVCASVRKSTAHLPDKTSFAKRKAQDTQHAFKTNTSANSSTIHRTKSHLIVFVAD